MEFISPAIDESYRRRVERARQRSPLEKMWDGPRLFEGVLQRMRAGISEQLKTKDPAVVEKELRRRLDVLKKAGERHDR